MKAWAGVMFALEAWRCGKGGLAWVFAVAAMLPGATACSGKPRSVVLHIRVTAVIDDHGVERSGSAVWSLVKERALIPLDYSFSVGFHGDAIPIRLGDGGAFFLLLQSWLPEDPTMKRDSPDADIIPVHVFMNHVPYQGSDEVDRLASIKTSRPPPGRLICPKSGVRQWVEPETSRIPTTAFCFQLGYARDPADMRTLTTFDPACAYFDPKCPIRIKRVTVRVTDDPVDRLLNAVLPWLKGKLDLLNGRSTIEAKRLGLPLLLFYIRS